MDVLVFYLAGYLIILFLLVFFFRDRNNAEDFLISGRNRGTWQVVLSKFASTVGVGWFIAYTAYAYEFGTSMFWMLIGVLIGYLTFAYWAVPKIYKQSREKKFYTQGDYIEAQTGSKKARAINDWVMIAVFFIWVLISFTGGGKLISHIGLMSYEWAVILTAIVILAYIILAGYRAIILTDVLQSIIILALLFFIVFALIGDISVGEVLSTQALNLSMGDVIGLFIYGLIAVFAASDRYLLAFASKDLKTAKHGQGLTIIPMVIVASLLLIIGLFVRMNNPAIDPGLVFVEAMSTYLPVAIIPIAIVLFFAGLMSSADTSVYVIASQYAFMKKVKNPVKVVRIISVLVIAIAAGIALVFSNIVDITVFGAILGVTPSVPILYLIFGKRNARKFILSISLSLISFGIGLIFMGVVPTLIAVVALASVVGLMVPNKWLGPKVA